MMPPKDELRSSCMSAASMPRVNPTQKPTYTKVEIVTPRVTNSEEPSRYKKHQTSFVVEQTTQRRSAGWMYFLSQTPPGGYIPVIGMSLCRAGGRRSGNLSVVVAYQQNDFLIIGAKKVDGKFLE